MTPSPNSAELDFCPACSRPGAAAGKLPPSPETACKAPVKLIRAGALMTSADEPIRRGASILVRGDRIIEVIDGHPDPAAVTGAGDASVELIDLSDHMVLPGLIDCHVHLLFENATGTGIEYFQKTDADWAIDGVANALATLRAGFTTVRDCGNLNGTPAIFALRDGIASCKVQGPRIVAAAATLTATGGAGDMLGFLPSAVGDPAHSGVADGCDGVRRAVRRLVKEGADFIKVVMTGGVLSDSTVGINRQFTDAEITVAVEEAHAWGRRVAAHAHSTAGINAALRAGVDSIEHGTYLDDESLRLFAERGAWLVPTLLAGRTVVEMADVDGFYPPAVRAKARRIGPDMLANFSMARAAGIRVAFGTDSGVSRHGENAREFRLLVDAGMTPLEAIRSATLNAADLLNLGDEIGSIRQDKCADIISVAGDPLACIDTLERPIFVMRAGHTILGI